MLHPLKVTSTLADETRYLIYEYMLQQKIPFTVTQIAEKFHIHPNVARLHLTKLTEIHVIKADYAKTGKGGRPGRVYQAAAEGISLTFPKREESLMLNWTLQLVEQLGDEALELAKKISFDDGFNSMKTLLLASKMQQSLTVEEKCKILSDSAALIGYIPSITDVGMTKKIIFSIYNCPFKNQLAHSAITCTLHESYIRGQMEALFSPTDFVQMESMVNECDFCKYAVEIYDKK